MNNLHLKIWPIILLCCMSSCSSSIKDKPIYTITDGFEFTYQMRGNNQGMLLINGDQDSIPFSFVIEKLRMEVIDSKKLKKKKMKFYTYKMHYLENNVIQYPILKKFDTLYSLKRARTFIYRSHLSIPTSQIAPLKRQSLPVDVPIFHLSPALHSIPTLHPIKGRK